jgi:hypothetical protein
MDRIARAVVQDSHFRAGDGAKTSNEEKSWRQQHPIAFGSLIGFAVGFSFVAFMATGGDTDFPAAVLFYGGIGAGVGALIGSFF